MSNNITPTSSDSKIDAPHFESDSASKSDISTSTTISFGWTCEREQTVLNWSITCKRLMRLFRRNIRWWRRRIERTGMVIIVSGTTSAILGSYALIASGANNFILSTTATILTGISAIVAGYNKNISPEDKLAMNLKGFQQCADISYKIEQQLLLDPIQRTHGVVFIKEIIAHLKALEVTNAEALPEEAGFSFSIDHDLVDDSPCKDERNTTDDLDAPDSDLLCSMV